MSEQPEETGQEEAPAVVVQAGLASGTGAAAEPESEPEAVPDPEGED
jgi:hypothetical protein